MFPMKLQLPKRAAEVPTGSAIARWNQHWARPAQNVLLLLTLTGIVYYFAHDIAQREKGTDFPDFYAAARMVREGYGHQLYDFQTQQQFQSRYAGRTGDYYLHPPFETLLFLPICLWSLPTAYLLWCLLNTVVLACTARVFQQHVFKRWDWRVFLPLFFLFPPVLLSFLQGHDSLLLLLAMTLAFVALRRERNFTAGCWLGCGLFKFHIVLALVVLVASLRRKGMLQGFVLVFVILLLISAGVSGWGFLTAYPRFLMNLHHLPLAGIHPEAMANIRGLVTVAGIVQNADARFALVGISSVLVVWYAWTSFKNHKLEFGDVTNLAFGNFVLAAILVSYHLSPPDLCIALLPIGLFSQYVSEHTGIPRWVRLSLLGSQCVLFLPPLHVISLASHVYLYLIIPILIMFLLTSAKIFRGIPRHADQSPVRSTFPPMAR